MDSRLMQLVVNGKKEDDNTYVYHIDGEDYLSMRQLADYLPFEMTIDENTNEILIKKKDTDEVPVRKQRELPEKADKVRSMIKKYEKRLYEINKSIFDHPEKGNQEHHACQQLTSFLNEVGFEVIQGLEGKIPKEDKEVFLDTAFKAVIKGKEPGPVIAVMLEYDALPMGHACGHNLIASSGMAAAIALAPLMKEVAGELWVMGTPAEEGGEYGGKIPLLHAGQFEGVDIALITHPGDRWDTGADFLAISGAQIEFTGKPSHASAAPEKGISALDAAIIAYNSIEMMREHSRSDARIHGIIKEGGTASNIVPERAVLSYAVRALDQPYVEVLKSKIENCVEAGAVATGALGKVDWSFGYSAPINVAELDHMVLDYARLLNINEIKQWEALGSSDLGNIGYEIPTCNLWFKITPEGVLPHTHAFLEASGSKDGFQSALAAGEVLAFSALELFENHEMVSLIQQKFHKEKESLLSQ